ncbi:hypothetical protein ILUMI_06188 [Ignelater luminosus]|uniref:NEDD4-binding protein 2 n=1 Tax=Ignelater luminosus TaxID=2038154 RepID=A0A8K0DG36_IGNLU|nr:hypothetical protein ILUMI_06188 [Ignelater luminosus]
MAANSGSMERTMQAEETVHHLIELFGNVLDLEIIQSVALNCDYNSMLQEWYTVIDGAPRFSKESFNALKLQVQEDKNVIINLVMDEISIRELIEYSNGWYYGYVDLGMGNENDRGHDNKDEAKSAFVFMGVSLRSQWKLPLRYCLIKSLSGSQRANLLKKCLQLIEECGAQCRSITFDGAAVNIAMCNEFPDNMKPSFKFYNMKVHTFWDACHMILLEMSSTIGAVPKQTSPEWKKNNGKQMMSYASATNNFPLKKSSDDDDVIFVPESPSRINPKKCTLSTQKKTASPQRKSKKEQEFDRVVLHVRQGSKILILMRGLPGSGKSYLAKQIIDRSIGYPNYSDFILSADDFFVDRWTGRYVYDRLKLTKAHEWNHQRAYKIMSKGISPVIIDNTNLQTWEMKPYVMMAVNFGYSIEIVEPFTHWAFNDKELARRNLHDVPKVKIKEMLERYEKNITPHKLLSIYCLAYSPNFKPPINRNYPPIDHLYCNGVSSTSFTNNISNKKIIKQNNRMKKAESPEVQDLMDFESDLCVRSASGEEKTNSESDLDNILMYNASSNSSPDILKPDICNFPHKHNAVFSINSEPEFKKARTFSENFTDDANIIKIMQDTLNFSRNETSEAASSSPKNAEQIKKARDLYPKLNLSSWGLPDDAVSSWETWDIVKPVNSSNDSETIHFMPNLNTASSTALYVSDSATNTSSADFAVLDKNDCIPENVKLLKARSRNINEGVIGPTANSSKKTLLDKSSMTNEDVLRAALSRERDASDEKHIATLISLFPGIPTDYLKDVYEKCDRDINWTGDILLDDKKEFIPFLQSNDNDNNNNDEESSLATQEGNRNENVSDSLQLNIEELSITPDILKENLDNKKNKTQEDTEEIKKHIEENVEINKNYYSEHILKLKNQRYGTTSKLIDSQPSTSKGSAFEAYPTSSGEVIAVNTDVDLDNFDPDIDFPEFEEEEMMELNLGNGVISQLETHFGFSQMLPQGFLPVIHVPVSLARQLYALYVESVLVQMENQTQVLDAIAKEDEEFARKLHMQEQRLAAANIYLKEIEEWKKLTPDNLALRLTRQKLYNAFPTVNQDLLIEILHAHNNSYEQTVEVLMASTDHDKINDPDGDVMDAPISETDINEMKIAEEETRKSAYAPDVPKTAMEYREEASQHHQKHMELMQQAQQAYQRKQYAVAQFYSDLAKTHTQLYDQANNLAASAFLQEHSKKLENFHTIDLHYLYVKEAIAALDMFIDTNIRLLEGTDKRQENLFVITGRGKRSDQGRSRIKPAVMARLRKRGIWYVEVNPGLLKIRVRPNSALTSSLH